MTTPPTETAVERAVHAVKLAQALSSAQGEALRAAFEDDQGTYHLHTVSAGTHRALQRKNLVHSGLGAVTDLGRVVRAVLVEGAAVVLEEAERQDAGPHAIVINQQRRGEVVSVRFASPDRLDDALFEMGVPSRYRAGARVPHDQRGTHQIRERRYTWAPAAAEPAPATRPTPRRQQHRVADDGTPQGAKAIRTLTPPMRHAIKTIVEDPAAPGVDGRTLDALLNHGLIQDIPGHYFPRFAVTDLGLLVHATLHRRASKEHNEPEQPDSDHAGDTRATDANGATRHAEERAAVHADLPAGAPAITVAPVPQDGRWQVLVTQESSTLYLVTVDHDPHTIPALDEAVRGRALELFARGSTTAIGGGGRSRSRAGRSRAADVPPRPSSSTPSG